MNREQAIKIVCRDFTLEKGWKTLERRLFGERAAPAVQRLEMKKMYYASFNELWRIMTAIASELSYEEAQKKLSELCEESLAFTNSFFEQVH